MFNVIGILQSCCTCLIFKMISVKDDNYTITNSTFLRGNDKESSSTLPHSPALHSEAAKVITRGSMKCEVNDSSKGRRIFLDLLPLIIAMGVVVVLMQIPSILYYTDPPSGEANLLEDVDLETCSVSLIAM